MRGILIKTSPGRPDNWVRGDDHEQLKGYSNGLHEQAQAAGLKINEFNARKGDVLVWAADLMHGGSNRCDADAHTRQSLVTHYRPVDCHPWYFYQQPVIREEIVPQRAFVSYPQV